MPRHLTRVWKRKIRPFFAKQRDNGKDLRPSELAEAAQELAELKTKAEAGELVLLSQDEARFPMVPTLTASLGVKGHRPLVGTLYFPYRQEVFVDAKLLVLFTVRSVAINTNPADALFDPASLKAP